MRRKIILTAIGIILVTAVVLAISVFRNSDDVTTGDEDGGETSSQEIPAANLNLKVPAGEKIQLGTAKGIVEVNNFYRSVVAAQEQFLIIKREGNYEVTYDTASSAFFINISKGSFDSVRPSAEDGFLKFLGVSREDACKLDVAVGAAREVSDAPRGVAPLSFCLALR